MPERPFLLLLEGGRWGYRSLSRSQRLADILEEVRRVWNGGRAWLCLEGGGIWPLDPALPPLRLSRAHRSVPGLLDFRCEACGWVRVHPGGRCLCNPRERCVRCGLPLLSAKELLAPTTFRPSRHFYGMVHRCVVWTNLTLSPSE